METKICQCSVTDLVETEIFEDRENVLLIDREQAKTTKGLRGNMKVSGFVSGHK